MFKDNSKIINFIVDWLREYCDKNSVEGFVVGVSGGIDSALTSTLCSMTNKPVICIQMPIHQSKNEIKNRLEQLRALDNNIRINVALAKESPLGVDTEEDFVAIKKIMEYKS